MKWLGGKLFCDCTLSSSLLLASHLRLNTASPPERNCHRGKAESTGFFKKGDPVMRRRWPVLLVLLGMMTAPFLTGCEIDEDRGDRDHHWREYHHYDHHDYDRDDRDWR